MSLSTPAEHRQYDVYRGISSHGDTLYVGLSVNAELRFREHCQTADWPIFASAVFIERVIDKRTAMVREAHLIETLQPEFNTARYPRLAVDFMRHREFRRIVSVRTFSVSHPSSPWFDYYDAPADVAL